MWIREARPDSIIFTANSGLCGIEMYGPGLGHSGAEYISEWSCWCMTCNCTVWLWFYCCRVLHTETRACLLLVPGDGWLACQLIYWWHSVRRSLCEWILTLSSWNFWPHCAHCDHCLVNLQVSGKCEEKFRKRKLFIGSFHVSTLHAYQF